MQYLSIARTANAPEEDRYSASCQQSLCSGRQRPQPRSELRNFFVSLKVSWKNCLLEPLLSCSHWNLPTAQSWVYNSLTFVNLFWVSNYDKKHLYLYIFQNCLYLYLPWSWSPVRGIFLFVTFGVWNCTKGAVLCFE